MRIECDNCGAKYSIADEKVAGRMIRLRCKKCGNNIRVDGTAVAAAEEAEDATRVFDPSAGGEWYVVINGEQSGPLSEADLYLQVQAGAVAADSLAWRDGMADWQAVVDIPELASSLGFADTGGEVEEEEATRVVAAPSESAAPEPFSFAGRPSALSESFAPAPAAAPAAAPAPAPAPAPVAVDNDAFFASSSAAAEPASDAGLTGQRKESSVLFSLSDLTSTRTATQKNEALPRTEGSGLIDIRVLAQSQAAVGGAAATASSDGGEAAPPMATRQMVPIVPMPVRRSNTGLYAILGVGGLIVVGLAAAVIVLLLREDPPPAPIPVAVAPAEPTPTAPDEASAPAAVAAAEPTAPSEGSVVVVPDEGSAAEGSAVAQADTEPAAAEQGSNTAPAAAEERPAAVARTEPARTPTPAAERTPTPSRPARTERAPEPEPTPAPTEREAAPASARDVIAGLNRNTTTATPTPAPTPAAAPDVPASLSRSEVQTTIRRYRSRIAGCNGASQAGTYRVSFRVAASGSTENVSVDNSDSIGTCLADVVRGMTFPRNGGETPPVTYPFSF